MPGLSSLDLAIVRASLKQLNEEAKRESGCMHAHALRGATKNLDERLDAFPSLLRLTTAITEELKKHPVRQANTIVMEVALLIGLAVDSVARRTWTEKRARKLKRKGG